MKQMSFIPLDVVGTREQIVLCHAFVRSSRYYHQELSVINPAPTQYDPAYIFPRDMYLYTYNSERDHDLLSIDGLVAIAEKKRAPIQCIGSHRLDVDRSMQLIWMPAEGGQDSQLVLQFIADVPAMEKQKIIEGLLQTCWTSTDIGGNGSSK